MKTLIKSNKKIIGFVDQRANGQWFYAFGKPSQREYIAFDCDTKQKGVDRINSYIGIYEL